MIDHQFMMDGHHYTITQHGAGRRVTFLCRDYNDVGIAVVTLDEAGEYLIADNPHNLDHTERHYVTDDEPLHLQAESVTRSLISGM